MKLIYESNYLFNEHKYCNVVLLGFNTPSLHTLKSAVATEMIG